MYKWWCGARGRKLEESRLNWALLAEVVRTGGLMMPLLMRLTYIPGHCAFSPPACVSARTACVSS